MQEALGSTGKALVFTSGSAVFGVFNGGEATEVVYGEDAAVPLPEEVFAPRSARVYPMLVAGLGEAMAARVETEHVVLADPGVRGIVVRPGLVYGNGGSLDIPAVISIARANGRGAHLGAGATRQSYVTWMIWQIATVLPVSREIVGNGGRDAYRALAADAAASERARRPKVSKLAANAELAGLVAAKLDDDWSPQQIAQWLRREHSGAAEMRVSHESIYRDVYMPSRKALDASMFHRLRSDRSIRRPLGKRSSYGRGQIRNTVSIRERPVEADTREVAGHRERLTRASTRRCAVSHGVADITTQLEWNESSLASS